MAAMVVVSPEPIAITSPIKSLEFAIDGDPEQLAPAVPSSARDWCADKDETANWQIWIDPVTYGREPRKGENGIIWEALRNRAEPLLTAEIKAIVRAQGRKEGVEPLTNRRIGECIHRLDRGGWLDAWEGDDGRLSWKLVTLTCSPFSGR
jgi:hypothetical protein